MWSGLLNAIYGLALVAVSPWLLYRRVVQRKPVAGFWDKLTGRIARRQPERSCVWFHAVSVGEVLQLQSLVADFAARHPEDELLITTTTGTGFDVARQKFPQHTIAYWPFDFSWGVTRALRVVQPRLVVLVELELWPNFLHAAQRHGVPVALVNARIGAKSYRGYRRLKLFFRSALQGLTAVAAQTPEYAQRLIDLGVPVERVTVTGNIKYDRVQSDRRNSKTSELRRAFGIAENELVFVAGSTQEPEEEYALSAWGALREQFPSLRLILVPRHKERFEEVAKLVESRRHSLRRRSVAVAPLKNPPTPPLAGGARGETSPICLLDTLGELAACWGLADIAFVGGSLTQRGGQNMLEPAGYGAAVLFGPNTWNFKDIVEQLFSRDAALVVHDADELRATVQRLLTDAAARQRLGDAARAFVLTQQGATVQTLAVLDRLLETKSATRRAA
jgi:3-deoxy-D-manno-octulosonic-acid transferase